ncbi:MAG: hypothetical protein WD851_11480 [Pirellulales bacterium]
MSISPRRTAALLTLLAGSAVISVSAVKISHRLLLRGLAAEVASNDSARAIGAVRELERVGSDGLPALSIAALGPPSEVSTAAQRAIEQLLGEWQREHFLQPTSDDYARRLLKLAEALASAAASTQHPAHDPIWAHRMAQRLLQLADRIPEGERAPLVLRCEDVLDATRPRIARNRPLAEPPAIEVVTNESPSPSLALPRETEPVKSVVGEDSFATAFALSDKRSSSSEAQPAEPIVPTPGFAASATPAADAPWQARWSTPAVAAEPIANLPTPAELQAVAPQMEPSDRELLRLWLVHALMPPVAGPIERQARLATLRLALAVRGFRDVRSDWIIASLSQRPADRLGLVDTLLTSSGRDAASWLLLLARDEAPPVRRAAILALITSRDRRILTLTHELALHDLDPQVAALAAQIGKLLR